MRGADEVDVLFIAARRMVMRGWSILTDMMSFKEGDMSFGAWVSVKGHPDPKDEDVARP